MEGSRSSMAKSFRVSAFKDFFQNTGLLKGSAERFKGWTEANLLEELETYSNLLEYIQNEEKTVSNTSIFLGEVDSDSIAVAKQLALYAEEIVFWDPLAGCLMDSNPDSEAFSQMIGVSEGSLEDRVSRSVFELQSLQSGLESNFVKLVPRNSQSQGIPVTASDNLFVERVPEELRKFFSERSEVRGAIRSHGAIAFSQELLQEPNSIIDVSFSGDWDRAKYSMLFTLFDSKYKPTDDPMVFEVVMTIDENPSREQFEIWKEQSINQAAGNLLEMLSNNVSAAAKRGSYYLTTSSTEFELLQTMCPQESQSNVDSRVLNALLELELPVMGNVDFKRLCELREGEASFASFRLELGRKLREIPLDANFKDKQQALQNLAHELGEVQLREVDQTIKNLSTGLGLDIGGLATGIFVANLQNPIVGACGVLVALQQGMKSAKKIYDFYTKTRAQPAFFLWQLARTQ